MEKGADMVARGLSNMDELEEVERQESSAALDAQVNGAFGVVDWGAVFSTVPDLSPLVDPGSSGGTLPVSPGNGGS